MVSKDIEVYTAATAPLPINYEAAKLALAACVSVDECKEWGDRAAAIASYARQKRDKTLFEKAQRIRARAVRRLGELVEGQRKKSGLSARKVARDAGISPRDAAQGQAVARVKNQVFERSVERSPPLSLTKLAQLGRGHPFGEDTSSAIWRLTERLLKLMQEFPLSDVVPAIAQCTVQQREAIEWSWAHIDAWQDTVQRQIAGKT